MKNYKIIVTATVEKELEVTANSLSEAFDIGFEVVIDRALYTINKDDIIAVSGEIVPNDDNEDDSEFECDETCEECKYHCKECDSCTFLTDEKCSCDCDYSCPACGICTKEDDEYVDEEFELRKQIFATHLSQIITDTTKYANDLFGV